MLAGCPLEPAALAECHTGTLSLYNLQAGRRIPLCDSTYTGWSRGNACFSYKNNFVYFQHKKVKITHKKGVLVHF
jgi:hypothetical protein